MMVMTTYLSQGCEGSVKTIRGLWLYDAIVEARVDWVPGLGNADANGDRS